MDVNFTPAGRIRRTSYAATLAVLNLAMIGVPTILPDAHGAVGLVRSIMMLALTWLLYCTMSKRLHDAGRGSALAAVLLALVALGGILMASDSASIVILGRGSTVLASILGLYILVAPPKRMGNIHGPDPRVHAIATVGAGEAVATGNVA